LKLTGQSYNDRQEKQLGGLGAEPPAAGGKRRFGGESSDAEAIYKVFSKKYELLSILWSKFLLKTRF